MSSSKVRILKDSLNYTATWLAGVLTVTTDVPHLLLTGNVVSLIANNAPQEIINVPITKIDGSTFTITTNINMSPGKVIIDYFRAGQTGRKVMSLPRSIGVPSVIQSYVTGTGGATYTLELSLDGTHWVTVSPITHDVVDGDTQFQTVLPAWTYAAINITLIGASTNLHIMYSA